MTFRYEHLFYKAFIDTNSKLIQNLKQKTGYGQLYRNFKLAQKFITEQNYKNQIIDVVQCDFCDADPQVNNCFVIFESDYLPSRFISTIKRQKGIVLVNSKWMKQVVMEQTGCNQNRILILPYLQDFNNLNRFKSATPVNKNNQVLTFYTIADYKDVKNILGLYDAFDIAFKGKTDVQLVIKTSHAQFLEKGILTRVNQTPKIKIINTMLPDIQLYRLHNYGDIYISTAYCVGWEIPPFQAAYLGKPLICGNHSAFTEWVNFDKSIALQSVKKVIPLREYNYAQFSPKVGKNWMVNYIEIDQIVSKLKYAYDNRNLLLSQKEDLLKYDISNINQFLQK